MADGQRIIEALEALDRRDRRLATHLIAQELQEGEPTGHRWQSVQRLAERLGETELALEASRRSAETPPVAFPAIMSHGANLTRAGRSSEALAWLDRLPQAAARHPAVLHMRGTIANELGDFNEADRYFREAIALAPQAVNSWFSLAMAKTFAPEDPDLDRLEGIGDAVSRTGGPALARYHYTLGKALVDVGEIERGFDHYASGAALRRDEERYDPAAASARVDALIRDFTPDLLASLQPSKFTEQRIILVNGLPRSGTTLVEAILTAHSQVADGGEVNLARAAMIPLGDQTVEEVRAYDEGVGDDPWGALADDYHRLVQQRLGGDGIWVDKTLSQSALMGLLLHMMPGARVLWLRRRPEDVALSAYRTFFAAPVRWSWSWEDIAHQMKLDDRLHAHWTALFPDRILTVPYEELVAEPDEWIATILDHVGLPHEPLRDFHRTQRAVRTASARQVRAPISTGAIGKAGRFADQLAPFRRAYFGSPSVGEAGEPR